MYAVGGPYLREMLVRTEVAHAARADAERQAPARADEAWVALDDAVRRRVSAAGAQLGRAEQGVDVAERGYRAGTATFFDLDSAVQLYLATALDARAALRDAHVAAARLAIVLGAKAGAPTPTDGSDD
jgi:outer membrane protein TolC